jgi:hypothetical protein
MRTLAWVGGLAFASVLAACSKSEKTSSSTGRPPTADEIPPMVAVGAQDTEIGFFGDRAQGSVRVEGFKITRSPVTTRDLGACAAAGACTVAEPVACTASSPAAVIAGPSSEALDAPAACVSKATAAAYCAWLGGSLPDAAEWLAAARGPTVRKYPWGADAPTCERHPVAGGLLATSRSCCTDDACTPLDLARIGTHPAGASPSGVQDVLVSSSELLRSTPSGCGVDSLCLVEGESGSPQGWRSVPATATAPVFTFRCVVRGS